MTTLKKITIGYLAIGLATALYKKESGLSVLKTTLAWPLPIATTVTNKLAR